MKNFMKQAPIIIIAVFMVLASCSKENPQEPAPDPTETPTPTPYYVDDFEDGDIVNALTNTWMYTVQGGDSRVDDFGLSTGAEKNGSYSLKVTGYAEAELDGGSEYWGLISTNSGATSGADPIDVTGYNEFKFSSYLGGTTTGDAYVNFNISISNGTDAAWGTLMADYDPVFREYAVDMYGLTLNGAAYNDVYSSVKQITFTIYAYSPTQYDGAEIEFFVDDIRFSR